MQETKLKNSAVNRILFTSPWLPLFFLAVFVLFIASEFVRLPRFIHMDPTLLLANNLCFLALIAARFCYYLARCSRAIRYGSERKSSNPGELVAVPCQEVQGRFAAAGFACDGNGYAEKKSFSYPAMALIYGGLLLALAVGSFDNMHQFSAVLFQGVGNPIALDNQETFLSVVKGPLSSFKGLPRFQIKEQILPNAQWPKGAVDLALLDPKGAVLTQTTLGMHDKPLLYQGLEYHFSRYLYDFILDVGTSNNHVEYSNPLKFEPLDIPRGPYTYYSKFKGERLNWVALLDPSRLAIRLIGSNKDKVQAESEIVFRKDDIVKFGNFDVRISGMSHWSEIHVVRPRHMIPIYVGGVIALCGLLLRLLFRPQRVWLEATPEGCLVWAVGSEAKKVARNGNSKVPGGTGFRPAQLETT